jgi:hypothetical protein
MESQMGILMSREAIYMEIHIFCGASGRSKKHEKRIFGLVLT